MGNSQSKFSPVQGTEEKSGVTSIETPWTSYRKLLYDILMYLKGNEDGREAFKVLFYRSIPTRTWDENIVEWLTTMEQLCLFSIDDLDRLVVAFENIEQPNGREILTRIRTFQLRIRTIQSLMASTYQEGEWLKLPHFSRHFVELSEELQKLFQRLRKRLRELPRMNWFHIYEIYNSTTQKITRRAKISDQSGADDANLLEAVAIADFLVEELSPWLLKQTDLDLEKAFGGSRIKRAF